MRNILRLCAGNVDLFLFALIPSLLLMCVVAEGGAIPYWAVVPVSILLAVVLAVIFLALLALAGPPSDAFWEKDGEA